MSVEVTRKEYLKLWRDDRYISQHTKIIEAVERASQDAETHESPGIYQVKIGDTVFYEVEVTFILGSGGTVEESPPSELFDWTHGNGPLQLSQFRPTLSSPTEITSVADFEANRVFSGWFSTAGDGEIYKIGSFSGANSGDLLIDMRGVDHELDIPVEIGRYRNVHIIGLQMVLLEQTTSWLEDSGTGLGAHAGARGNEKFNLNNRDSNNNLGTWLRGLDLHEVNDPENVYFGNPGGYTATFDNVRGPGKGWNIHPRMAGILAMLKIHASGTVFIEGCLLDAQGQQGDLVIMASNGDTDAFNLANSKTYFQNTRILDYDGQSYHKNYGDGVHGDSWQSQGSSQRHSTLWENVHIQSLQEGQVNTGGACCYQHTTVRQCQYINGPDATNEINLNDYAPPGEKSGGPAWASKNKAVADEGSGVADGGWYLEKVWVENKSNVLNLSDDNLSPADHAEINDGISSTDWAPLNEVGKNYQRNE